jgi:hypothetical protein
MPLDDRMTLQGVHLRSETIDRLAMSGKRFYARLIPIVQSMN